MGFLNKIKDILFEEVEEEEVKVAPKKVEKPVERAPIAEKIEPQRRPEVAPPVREVPVSNPEPVRTESRIDTLNERDLFKSENTFPFPDFDEEEFSNSVSRVNKPTSNVLEYEKKKRIEKKYDLGRYERIEKTEVVEKKKFKPSPIISPVYGILNEDYTPDDITNKTEVDNKAIDFNSVRKKAFETPEIEEIKEVPKETYYEETVTVKVKEPVEEKIQKVKTIDELLEDTADMTIDIEHPDKNEYDKIEDELEEIVDEHEPVKEEPTIDSTNSIDEDDTLESDLFDLIDSMYDNREDGE